MLWQKWLKCQQACPWRICQVSSNLLTLFPLLWTICFPIDFDVLILKCLQNLLLIMIINTSGAVFTFWAFPLLYQTFEAFQVFSFYLVNHSAFEAQRTHDCLNQKLLDLVLYVLSHKDFWKNSAQV